MAMNTHLTQNQMIIVKKVIEEYSNFNVSAYSPHYKELKDIMKVLDNEVADKMV